jgi:hypothetical protein
MFYFVTEYVHPIFIQKTLPLLYEPVLLMLFGNARTNLLK